ncbi:hypothetical protein CY35_11G097900 [Sphagnum magellanicum]|nr:hypothetical protein CY35_11G097900 [Sphagnum magellanicum]
MKKKTRERDQTNPPSRTRTDTRLREGYVTHRRRGQTNRREAQMHMRAFVRPPSLDCVAKSSVAWLVSVQKGMGKFASSLGFVCGVFGPLYFRGRKQTVLQGLHSFVIHSLPFEELRLAVNLYCTGSGFSNNKVLNR